MGASSSLNCKAAECAAPSICVPAIRGAPSHTGPDRSKFTVGAEGLPCAMDLLSATMVCLFFLAKYAVLRLLHEVESVFLDSPSATLFLRKGTVQVTKVDKNQITGTQTLRLVGTSILGVTQGAKKKSIHRPQLHRLCAAAHFPGPVSSCHGGGHEAGCDRRS